MGMSQELVDHVLEPFVQGEDSNKKGTGLGLYITSELIKKMDGVLEIESEIDKGTKMTVTLIADRCDLSEAAPAISKELMDWEKADFTEKRVLLVEDNEINSEIAILQMQSLGLLVDHAWDGKEAVAMVMDSEEFTYDMIFMDIMMPEMDGLEATRKIRQLVRKDVKTMPIVAMTANAFAEDVNRSIESGMNAHMSKPFEKKDMVQILIRYMNK